MADDDKALGDKAAEVDDLRREVAYLRLLVWRLSIAGLADQHPRYRRWLGVPHVQEMPR